MIERIGVDSDFYHKIEVEEVKEVCSFVSMQKELGWKI